MTDYWPREVSTIVELGQEVLLVNHTADSGRKKKYEKESDEFGRNLRLKKVERVSERIEAMAQKNRDRI